MQPPDNQVPPVWPSPAEAPDLSTARPLHRRRSLANVGLLAAVLLLLAFLAVAIAIPAMGVSLPLGFSAAPPVPADWQTYRDPAGLFSVRLPPSWTVRICYNNGTLCDDTSSTSETGESIDFSDPTLGDASPYVYVEADPISTAWERDRYCQALPDQDKHDSFHGLPAEYDSQAGWRFETANAYFQIAYDLPPHQNDFGIAPPTPTLTPLPPATRASYQTLVETILGSFQPTDPHALVCS